MKLIEMRARQILHLVITIHPISLPLSSNIVDATSIIRCCFSTTYPSSSLIRFYPYSDKSTLFSDIGFCRYARPLRSPHWLPWSWPWPRPRPSYPRLPTTALHRPSTSLRRWGYRLRQPWATHTGTSQIGRWLRKRSDSNDTSVSRPSGSNGSRGRLRGHERRGPG